MGKILGKDFILYAVLDWSPEQRIPIGCARSVTLTTTTQIAPISTVGSGIWQEFKGLSLSWNVSTDGLCTFDVNMSIPTLRMYQFGLTPMYFELVATSGTTQVTYSGYAIIQNVDETGSYSDVMNYSVQLQGTGELYNSGDFRIINVAPDDPDPGTTTLTFTFSQLSGASAYTIRVRDITTGEVVNNTQGAPPHDIPVDSTHAYAFSYRPQAPVTGQWSPEIYWNLDATSSSSFLIDSNGDFIVDSNGDFILYE